MTQAIREQMKQRAEALADQVRRGLRSKDGALSALAAYSEHLTGYDDPLTGGYAKAWALYDYGVKCFKCNPKRT